MTLFSSVLPQLTHLSITYDGRIEISDPCTISGEVFEQLCPARLNATATYRLQLLFYVNGDAKEKRIFRSFVRLLRRRPQVYIREMNIFDVYERDHSFLVYTSPCKETRFSSHLLSRNPQPYVYNNSRIDMSKSLLST